MSKSRWRARFKLLPNGFFKHRAEVASYAVLHCVTTLIMKYNLRNTNLEANALCNCD